MIHNITWHNIPIEINYNPDYSKAYHDVYGYGLAHIKIQAGMDCALPITDTGFRSQFIAEPCVSMYGSVENFVMAMLNEASQNPKWIKQETEQQQLNLF